MKEFKIKFFYRQFLFSFYFLFEKLKRLIKTLYRLNYFCNNKTILISDLIKKGDAFSKFIFKGSIYSLRNKFDLNNKNFKYLPEGNYKVPDYKIYIIDSGIVKSGSNSIFTKEGKKILGTNFEDEFTDINIIFNLDKINKSYLDGTVLVLGIGLLGSNYSHAWTELAARAYAIKISKLKYDYILIDNRKKFILEILNLLDFPLEKIIYSENYEFIKAKKLIYPPLINNHKEYFLNGVFVYHRKYLPYWITDLYNDVSKKVLIKNSDFSHEKIYISRLNKKQRSIVNEKDLIFNLEKLGFKTIFFEDYSVLEQIKLIKKSKQIIAIHGAGLVNINFCNKGTKILELFPYYYQCAFFYMHANMNDLKYDYYIGEPVNKLWRKSPIMENFFVNIKIIKAFIRENWY